MSHCCVQYLQELLKPAHIQVLRQHSVALDIYFLKLDKKIKRVCAYFDVIIKCLYECSYPHHKALMFYVLKQNTYQILA